MRVFVYDDREFPDPDPNMSHDEVRQSMTNFFPELAADAKQKWETTPRYPKADLPKPPPSPTPARTPTTSRTEAPKAQPSFF